MVESKTNKKSNFMNKVNPSNDLKSLKTATNIKKYGTSAIYANQVPHNFKKEISKIKTFSKEKMSDISIIRLMSENVYSLPSKRKDDSDSDYSSGEDNEINVEHKSIIVKTKTIKKMANVKNNTSDLKATPDNKNSNQNSSLKRTSTFAKKDDDILDGKKDFFAKKEQSSNDMQIVEADDDDQENDFISEFIIKDHPHEAKANDDILQSLIDQYYMDISENISGICEDYIVNNLTIVSYLDKIIPHDSTKPKLKKEVLKSIESFDRSKKILYLDLDETLIHSDINNQFDVCDAQISIPVDENNEAQLNLMIRPYLTEFLEFCSKNFNVVLFTAGIESYADAILAHIDPMDQYFHLRLYRDSCFEFRNFFIKDLGILETFGLKDMIILDNCIFSFAKNLKNGILISSYYNNQEDKELLNVIDYLKEKILDVKDVREVNESFYGLETIRDYLYQKLQSEGVC